MFTGGIVVKGPVRRTSRAPVWLFVTGQTPWQPHQLASQKEGRELTEVPRQTPLNTSCWCLSGMCRHLQDVTHRVTHVRSDATRTRCFSKGVCIKHIQVSHSEAVRSFHLRPKSPNRPFDGRPCLPHESLFLMFIHEGLFHNSSKR